MSQVMDDDDYEQMLDGRQTKNLDRGKGAGKSKRGRPTKDGKAIATAEAKSCMNQQNCAGGCLLF